MSESSVLLVSGSRALTLSRRAREWALAQLHEAIYALPVGGVVVAGDAVGPDEWGFEIAGERGVLDCSRFTVTGAIHTRVGRGVWRLKSHWTTEPRPARGDRTGWRTRCLARDRAMVEYVVAMDGEKRCLALVAPWSKTRGTGFTARLALQAGISTKASVCDATFEQDEE